MPRRRALGTRALLVVLALGAVGLAALTHRFRGVARAMGVTAAAPDRWRAGPPDTNANVGQRRHEPPLSGRVSPRDRWPGRGPPAIPRPTPAAVSPAVRLVRATVPGSAARHANADGPLDGG